MKENCSILVLSCDKNINVVKIFLDFFWKNWPECNYPLYIGLEKEKADFEKATTILSEKNAWSQRVKEYLEHIDSDHVLLILDDFIIEKKVDDSTIDKVLHIMEEQNNIANIALADIYDKRNQLTEFEHLRERKWNGNYLVNMQIGIWKKDILLLLLKNNESPWQTELYGSIRARKLKRYRFLCLDSDKHMPIKYNRGWLLVRGAWNGNEIKRLKLENYGELLFDGKDILYLEYGKIRIPFGKRCLRRMGICLRQVLSYLGVYL